MYSNKLIFSALILSVMALNCQNRAPKIPAPEAVEIRTAVKTVHLLDTAWNRQIPVRGYLEYDRREQNDVSARFSGRITKLYVKYLYQPVLRGRRLMDIYSPEIVSEEENLVYLLNNDPDAKALIDAAAQKLKRLGLIDVQIRQIIENKRVEQDVTIFSPADGITLEPTGNKEDQPPEMAGLLSIKEGAYIDKGQRLFKVADPKKLWALIFLPPNDFNPSIMGKKAVLKTPGSTQTITGQVDFLTPFYGAGSEKPAVRVYFSNENGRYKAGEIVEGFIESGAARGLWAPESAVADLGGRKIVWQKKGSGFQPATVLTGVRKNGYVLILKGLGATDVIAANGGYMTDSEKIIR